MYLQIIVTLRYQPGSFLLFCLLMHFGVFMALYHVLPKKAAWFLCPCSYMYAVSLLHIMPLTLGTQQTSDGTPSTIVDGNMPGKVFFPWIVVAHLVLVESVKLSELERGLFLRAIFELNVHVADWVNSYWLLDCAANKRLIVVKGCDSQQGIAWPRFSENTADTIYTGPRPRKIRTAT